MGTHTHTHRHTDTQTHRHTDTGTHRHTHTHTHTHTHRHTGAQAHRHTGTRPHARLVGDFPLELEDAVGGVFMGLGDPALRRTLSIGDPLALALTLQAWSGKPSSCP